MLSTWFGCNFKDDIFEKIDQFKKSYLAMIKRDKVHAVFHHLIDFICHKNMHLGQFSEQVVEATSRFSSSLGQVQKDNQTPRACTKLGQLYCGL